MGTQLAKTETGRLLDAVGVQRVVVVGITGAVDNTTPIGTLVLPEVVVDSVSGVEYRPAPFGGGSPHGKMWTTDLLLTDTDEVAGLRARGVVSLDMETAAVAEVCEGRGIPWSVFRAISDRATDGSIDEEIFHLSHRDGTPNEPAVARYLLRHPARISHMVRLGRGVNRAAETAAETAAAAAVRACSQP
jgi:uridine phosphorylase